MDHNQQHSQNNNASSYASGSVPSLSSSSSSSAAPHHSNNVYAGTTDTTGGSVNPPPNNNSNSNSNNVASVQQPQRYDNHQRLSTAKIAPGGGIKIAGIHYGQEQQQASAGAGGGENAANSASFSGASSTSHHEQRAVPPQGSRHLQQQPNRQAPYAQQQQSQTQQRSGTAAVNYGSLPASSSSSSSAAAPPQRSQSQPSVRSIQPQPQHPQQQQPPPARPQQVTAQSLPRTWSVPNPLSAIPTPNSDTAISAATPNPLASASTAAAATGQSRAALAAHAQAAAAQRAAALANQNHSRSSIGGSGGGAAAPQQAHRTGVVYSKSSDRQQQQQYAQQQQAQQRLQQQQRQQQQQYAPSQQQYAHPQQRQQRQYVQQQPQQRQYVQQQSQPQNLQQPPRMQPPQSRPQQQQQQPQPQRSTTKVVLSAEAKQALGKAIWSAIRSKDGTPDPQLVAAAEATGLPRNAILNAAQVARKREQAKRQQQRQQQPQASSHSSSVTTSASQQQTSSASLAATPSSAAQPAVAKSNETAQTIRPAGSSVPSSAPIKPQTKPPVANPVASSASSSSESQKQQPQQQKQTQQQQAQQQQQQATENPWKRVQSGVFVVQKGRFLVLPHSVGAYSTRTSASRTTNAVRNQARRKFTKAPSRETLQLARLLQQQLKDKLPTEKLVDPSKFRRVKIEPKKHAKALERAVRKARQSTADALLKTQKDFTKALLSHQTEFFKFHKNRKTEALRIAKACRDTLDKEEKQKQKEEDAAERARLAALKSNDMSAYSKLLEETKNDRLKFLMDKTEESFSQISSLLHQRGGATEDSTGRREGASYYESAHFKSEEVRQPSILIGGDLKEYQLAGLQWLVSLYNNKLNGILADEMGLGKTIQAISLIAYLMEFKHNLGPYLVIVPLSTLSNWQNEFIKWCPSARLVCYKGTPAVRKELYKDQVSKGHFNVLLTTYEYIIKDKKYLRKINWTYAIVDEGHRMKNAQSRFAVTLGTHYNTEYRVLLTGTPLMNQLSELWSLLNFLLPTIFNSVETFDQWFSRPFSQFGSSGAGKDDKEGEADQLLSNEERMLIIHRLHELLRPFMLRRVKSEVLDQLPQKVEKILRCELSSWQKELYKQISVKTLETNSLLNDSFVQQPVTPSRGLNNVVMQLRKVCNHPMLFTPEGYQINDQLIRSSGKVALLDQMLPKLKAAGHRVLIFTQMTAVMTILEDYFSYRGHLSLRLDGSTPAEEREKRMYKFNAPDSPYFIFLLSTRAGGLGLNLTAADTVIIFDSDWNPMMDLQAQDRAHRIGQRADVSVFRMITNSPVEEKILKRATEKLNVSELVVEAGKFNKGSVEEDNSLERKQMMEILLTDFDTATGQKSKGQPSEKSATSDNEDDEDEDGSNSSNKEEDLNELLSNNEIDYQMYADYDEKRKREGIPLAEVYTDPDDVPDWIKYPGGNKQAAQNGVHADIGDGSRKRKAVAYDDGLTEKQFMRLMDKKYAEEEKKEKVRKQAKKTARASISADDNDDAVEAPNIESDLTDWTFRKLISCSKTVVTLKDPATKRRLSELFLEKPPPQQFPDYYEMIEKPIAINDILRKCRAKLYTSIQEFRDDWKLMVSNAIKFNGEGSWVAEDALALEKELERVLKRNGFSEDNVPTSKKSKKKKLRIKLSLKGATQQNSQTEGGIASAPGSEPEQAPPVKRKRGRPPKKKS